MAIVSEFLAFGYWANLHEIAKSRGKKDSAGELSLGILVTINISIVSKPIQAIVLVVVIVPKI